MKANLSPPNFAEGFSLVEITAAIGLLSFCLVALLGMLPVGLNQERKSRDQMATAQALAAIVTDFQNSPTVATVKYGLSPGSDRTLELDGDLNDLRQATPGTAKKFHAVYTLERGASPAACDRLTLRVIRLSDGVSAGETADYLESVILKTTP